MLRTLVFAGIAAIAGRQLYKNGSLQRFSDKARERADELKHYAQQKRDELRNASTTSSSGTPGAAVRPTTVHNQHTTPA